MEKGDYYQQGDVILTKVDKEEIADRLKNGTRHHTPIIQLGESTGHAHRIDGSGYMIHELWGNRYLELKKDVVLRHEEHKPIDLLKGFYKIGIVKEYDHWKEETRRVRD